MLPGVDRLELGLGVELVEGHVERYAQIATAHLPHAAGDLDEPLRALEVELVGSALPGALETSDHHAVNAVRTGVADVGLHGLELKGGVDEVAPARADDRSHLGALMRAHKRDGLLDHARRRRGAALRKVVAELDAVGARAQGSLDVGAVLGAILKQHGAFLSR